mgnify:FL=1
MSKSLQRSATAIAGSLAKAQAEILYLRQELARQAIQLQLLRQAAHEAELELRVAEFDAVWQQKRPAVTSVTTHFPSHD